MQPSPPASRSHATRELPDLIAWAHGEGHAITLIETMPLGEIDGDRIDSYLPLDALRARLEQRWTLKPSEHRSGGPARYFDIAETGGRLGLITPLTENFCGSCNRMRVTATGQLYPCLGGGEAVDLRAALRSDPGPHAGSGCRGERKQHDRAHEEQVETLAVFDVAEGPGGAGGCHVRAEPRIHRTSFRSHQDVVIWLIDELSVIERIPAAGEMRDPQHVSGLTVG